MVHGRGMRYTVRAVGLDAAGVVVGSRVLLPGRFVTITGASYIIELPLDAQVPQLGAALEARPIVLR